MVALTLTLGQSAMSLSLKEVMSALYRVSYLSEDVMNYLDFDTAVVPAVISLQVWGIVYTRFAQILISPFNKKTSMFISFYLIGIEMP